MLADDAFVFAGLPYGDDEVPVAAPESPPTDSVGDGGVRPYGEGAEAFDAWRDGGETGAAGG